MVASYHNWTNAEVEYTDTTEGRFPNTEADEAIVDRPYNYWQYARQVSVIRDNRGFTKTFMPRRLQRGRNI